MDLTQAKYLEYAIYLFKEMSDYSNSLTYKVVWKFGNGALIAGNFLELEGGRPVTKYLDSELTPITERNNALAPYSFSDFRATFFNEFPERGNWNLAYTAPAELLEKCIPFVCKLKKIQNQKNLVKLSNVDFLDSHQQIDFLLLDSKTEVKPVSLISVSEN